MQFREQTFLGTKSIPKDKPNLLEGTGPKIYLNVLKNDFYNQY